MEAQALIPSIPLLRPDQVLEMEDERDTLQRKLNNPNVQDKAVVSEQLRRLKNQLDTQRPTPYADHEIDAAVRLEAELRGKWMQGMLSQEEMRKCPPGAADKHRAWEKRNKKLIGQWQNLQRRLTAGSDDMEAASIERFRPVASSMNMDGALIPGKQFFLGPMNAGLPVVFSEEQMNILRALNPQLADMIGTLTNRERASVKDTLTGGIGLTAEPAMPVKAKRVLSESQKAAMKAGRDAKAKKA